MADDEIPLARQGTSRDPAIAAIVAFAQQVLAAPAEIVDANLERLHAHGQRQLRASSTCGVSDGPGEDGDLHGVDVVVVLRRIAGRRAPA